MVAAFGNKLRNTPVFRRSTITLILRALGVSLLLLLHVVLGRFLGPEQYGLYSYALSLAGVLTGLAALGLPTAMMRFVGEYAENRADGLLAGALLALPLLALLASITFAAGLYVASFALDGAARTGAQFAAVLLPLFVLEQVRRCLAKAQGQPVRSVLPDEIFRPVILIACVVLAALATARQALWLYGISTLALSLVFLLPLWIGRYRALPAGPAQFDVPHWVRTALPMAFAGVGYLLLSRTDVIMLGILSDMQSTGVYAAANRIAMLNQIILGTAAVVVTPLVTRAWHGGRPREVATTLGQTRIWILAFTLPVFAVIVLFAGPLLGLFGESFADGALVLRVLAAGQLVNAVAGPVGMVLSMIGQQKVLALTMLAAAVVNIVLNALAIPIYGELGAAVASAVCFSLLNVLLLWRVQRALTAAVRSSD